MYNWIIRRSLEEINPDTWDLAHHMGAKIYKRYRFYKKEIGQAADCWHPRSLQTLSFQRCANSFRNKARQALGERSKFVSLYGYGGLKSCLSS